MSERSSFSTAADSPMAEVLKNTIAGMTNVGQIRQSLALAYWPRVVGALWAKSSTAVEVSNRDLIIRTKSSAWSHEISMKKHQLLQELNRLLEGNLIKDIKCRTDGTPWPELTASSDTPTSQELDAVLLSPHECDVLRIALESLETVSAAHARQVLSKRIITEAKLGHWRLERGWRICLRCAAAHKTTEPICPICRLTP